MKALFVSIVCIALAPLVAQRSLDPSAYRVVDLTHTLGPKTLYWTYYHGYWTGGDLPVLPGREDGNRLVREERGDEDPAPRG